jgi:dienelactone hydrolase
VLYIRKNAKALIVVVHEIYGINQHIKDYCSRLSELDFDVICPNLLNQETPYTYHQEKLAYKHFMEYVGFEKAKMDILEVLFERKEPYEKIFMVGFSIGATISWLCSDVDFLDGVVGFYGSQIRNHLEVKPVCPTMLFFPEREKSFSVDELILNLRSNNVETHKYRGLHGFSDSYSETYHSESEQQAFDRLVHFLETY